MTATDSLYEAVTSQKVSFLRGELPSWMNTYSGTNATITANSTEGGYAELSTNGEYGRISMPNVSGTPEMDAIGLRAVVSFNSDALVEGNVTTGIDFRDNSGQSGQRMSDCVNDTNGDHGTILVDSANHTNTERHQTVLPPVADVPHERELLWDYTEGKLIHRAQGRFARVVTSADVGSTQLEEIDDPGTSQRVEFNAEVYCGTQSGGGDATVNLYELEVAHYRKLD